jgi:hypothetical protein
MSPEHAANHPELAQAWHTGHTGTLLQFVVSPKKNVKCLQQKRNVYSIVPRKLLILIKTKAKSPQKSRNPKTPKSKPPKLQKK